MSKHMTIINLACTITKVRKWGEGWKHSAESAYAAFEELQRKHKEAERTIETLRANLTQTEAECQAELAVVKDERDRLRVERDALRAEIDNLTTPCDPPEASHITPEGLKTAAGAVEPKPGDVVRLVRVPTVKDCSEYDYQDSEQLRLVSTQVNTLGKVVGTARCEACARVSVDDNGTIKAWPLSCIEVVKGADK